MSKRRTSVTGRVASVIAVPLVVQLVFLGLLFLLLERTEHAIARSLEARQVLNLCRSLSSHVVKTVSDIGNFSTHPSERAAFERRYRDDLQSVNKELSKLVGRLKRDGRYDEQVKELEQAVASLQVDMADSGDVSTQLDARQSVTRGAVLADCQAAVERFAAAVRHVTRRYQQESEKYERAQRHSPAQVAIALAVGSALNIGVAAWLVFLASRSTLKDISLLGANVERFKSGEELQPPAPALDDEISELNQAMCTASDAIRSMEHELELSRLRHEAVLSSTPDGLLVLDDLGNILFANGAACKILQIGRSGLLGKNVDDYIERGESRDVRYAAPYETWAKTSAGPLPVEVATGTLLLPGQKAGALLSFKDIRRRHETRRVKEEFIRALRGELDRPLGRLLEACGELADGRHGTFSESGVRKLKAGSESIAQLLGLISQLVDVTELRSGDVPLVRTEVPVTDVVSRATAQVSSFAESSGVTVTAVLEEVRVKIDPDAIRRVLTNLVSNAVKFSPPGSEVVVEVNVEGADLFIRVIDRGRGIPEDKVATLFNRFIQVRAEDARSGSGLGLLICKRTVEAHGGHISAESEEGKGTVFRICLPRCVVK